MKFIEHRFVAPDHDFDLVVVFPNGKELLIQARPSNADVNYNGSLDIILPDNQDVVSYEGDELKPSKRCGHSLTRMDEHQRYAKQLITQLP